MFKGLYGIYREVLDSCIQREKFDVTPFLDKRCKHPVEAIQSAVDGAISREQAVKLKECLRHIDEISAHKQNIEQEILRLAEPYSSDLLSLIRTAPGLSGDPMTAIWNILSKLEPYSAAGYIADR